jgi:putative transposase
MARRPRIRLPGAVYHVHTRGNRKQSIFRDDDDRELFLRLVGSVHRQYGVRMYAVCLMETHYHAMIEAPRDNLSDAMRQLNGVFTQATNRRHGLTGHLFGERFSATIIERDRSLRRCVRYVMRNPVKSGAVKHPADWPWSTYRATAGEAASPEWLTSDWLPWAFEADSLAAAQRKFAEYVNQPRAQKAINWNQIGYGSKEFEAALAEVARRRRAERPLPCPTQLEPPPPLPAIFADVHTLEHRDRLIVHAHVRHGYSLSEISRHLNLHVSGASRVLRRLEGKRLRG